MLEYVRLGFASNSSSSHSIILLNDKVIKFHSEESHQYSFDSDFMLTSENGKMEYLLNQCFLNFRTKLGPKASKELIERMFNKSFKVKDIDHQSIAIISEKVDENLKIEFLTQLVNYLAKNEKIAIFGDWDSGDNSTYDAYPGVPKDLFTSFLRDAILRKEGDYQWTLFDKAYGYKLKLKLNDTLAPLDRPFNPELLDISITDRCFSNCSFCYRGSNKDGDFAASEKIKKLIDGAKALGVFEIVFGGGEPTLHPDFPKILEYTHEKGIAANFTTNNLDWTKDVNTLYKIIRNTSSITISVHSLKDLLEKKNILEASHKSLEALRKQNEQVYYHEFECFYKIIFQIVVDLVPDAELKEIVEYTSKNRTLLSMVGFKNTGRAKNLLPEKKKNLREMILAAYSDYESPDGLSVDTCFLKEYPEFVQKLTCNLKEGWESFFIDATNEYFAISSFSKELKKINMNVKPLELEDEMHGFFKNLEPK